MAKVTVIFESETRLPNGPHVKSYEVDEAYAPYFEGAVAAHPTHGTKQVSVQYQELNPAWAADQPDPLDPPQYLQFQRWEAQPTTFEEGLDSWCDTNVRDPILGAVNKFAEAVEIKKATANIQVPKIGLK